MADDSETIFTKIIKREIPADIVYETETIIAFKDINPQAPVHVLIVPKKQIKDLSCVSTEDTILLGDMFLAADQVAEIEGVRDSGYRLIVNSGFDGGQEVPHLHIHILGGREIGPLVVNR